MFAANIGYIILQKKKLLSKNAFNFFQQVYHFCHKYGKQDTFYCPYGTIFNEYLGTCDYKNNVKCSGSGKGYKGPLPKPHPEEPYHPPPHHDDGGYHAPPKPYKHHVSYHEHEQYHQTGPHDSYGPPHHEGYAPPPVHHESYEQPPPYHHEEYHEPPPYHVDAYHQDVGYNGDSFRGEKTTSFLEGFGSGFGKGNGFGAGFGGQDLRRSGKKRSSSSVSSQSNLPIRRSDRRNDNPRKLNFGLPKKEVQHVPTSDESDFGFDGLKAFGFGLRV